MTAARLADEKATLVLSYRANRERALPLESLGALVQADITEAADRRRLLDAAPALYGLVVLAGDPARVREGGSMEAATAHSMAVNFSGPMLLAREAAERMKAAQSAGSIVLFSTMQAVNVVAGSTAYASAKVALQHAALVLAKEVRGFGIRVNVVAPGVTAAGMALASIASGKYEHLIRDGIVPRYGRATDVAAAVRFFLEPDNYVTGQVLRVDGGATL
ncbi:MAG: SDR family oxidoreductase [Bryobacterales bacterium]|nr:SDR family oxidoreductase [Bryobacterales bacterium]